MTTGAAPTTGRSDGTSSNRLTILAREHLGVLISAGLFCLIVLRVLGVAQFDVLTALAVLQAGGAANVALGSALASAPIVGMIALSYVGPILARRAARPDQTGEEYWRGTSWFWVLFFIAFLVQWWLLAFYVLVIVIAWARGVHKRRRPPKPSGTTQPKSNPANRITSAERTAWLLLPLFSQLVITAQQSWLPTEAIQLSGDTHTFTAYVLSQSDQDVVLLRSGSDTRVIRVPSSDVRSRTICRSDSSIWDVTAFGLLSQPEYKRCPD